MDIQEKKRIAQEMLDDGATLPEITARLGYASNAATSKLISLLRQDHGPAPQPAAPPSGDLSEVDRLDAMLNAIWPDCMNGKVSAIQVALKIQQRRSELAAGGNLPTPTTVEAQVQPVDEFTRRLRQRLSADR